DAIYIGQGVGFLGMAGLTVAFPIQMFILAVAQMVGIGGGALISISLGEGNVEKADNVAGNAYLLTIVLGIAIMVLGSIFIDPILQLFGATDAVLPYAKAYMSVIFIGAVFFSFSVVGNNLVRSEGNAMVAMISMLLGAGLNILLDPLFIFTFGMGIRGAAIATILAQFISFLYLLRYMYSGKSLFAIKSHHLVPHPAYMAEILKLGFPAFSRQVGGSILAIFLNNAIVHYGGDVALSAYGAINRIISLLFMPMFGVLQGFQPIAGYNYGAKRLDRVRDSIKITMVVLLIMATAGWAIAQLFPEGIMRLFTSEPEVVKIGTQAIRLIILAIPFVSIQIMSASVYQSLGKPGPAFFLSLLRQFFLFIPLMFIIPAVTGLGLNGLWITFPVADVISTIVSIFMLMNLSKEMKLMEQIQTISQKIG
ncbi:MAG: MATE family efflux transporter, partial [Erysipelotrichaceae bacterium]|nr:MATE family efflux transporter [Erysipelotrichaceae bacterium]